MKAFKGISGLLILLLSLPSCSELLFWKKEEISVYQAIRIEEEEGWTECEISDKEPKRVNADASYFWFKNRAVHMTHGDYGGNLLHGEFKRFYVNGTLRGKGAFLLGLKEGAWKCWNSRQMLVSEYTFHKGQKHGPFREYKAGELITSGTYKNDQYEGKLHLHTDPGIAALVYKGGAIVDTVFMSTQ